MSNFDARGAIFTPAETSALGVEWIQQLEQNKHRAMPFPMPLIGDYIDALLPGEVCGVQAQTSNYKSGLMNYWEYGLARHLRESGREDEVIIHVDTEMAIQSLAIQEIARGSGHNVGELSSGNVRDWRRVMQAAGRIAGIDIYRIAGSLGSEDMPELHLSNIYRAIQYAVSGKLLDRPIKPACIFVDYLQALPIDPEVKKTPLEGHRRLQVRQDVYRLRQMAVYFNCPMVVGIQAKQTLSGTPGSSMLIPGMYDGEETSSIAQRFDRLISLWMPKTTHSVGEVLNHKNISFQVEENLIWVKVLKQRGGRPAGRAWKCYIRYEDNSIAPSAD